MSCTRAFVGIPNTGQAWEGIHTIIITENLTNRRDVSLELKSWTPNIKKTTLLNSVNSKYNHNWVEKQLAHSQDLELKDLQLDK